MNLKEPFTHAKSEEWRQQIHEAWKEYVKKCESVMARPNARAFVKNWNERHPERSLSYSHFAGHIKKGPQIE